MPTGGSYCNCKEHSDMRKKKKEYWMDKGCSESKAEKLLFRYEY